TSDVIVGFPGETEEEFMETYQFIKDIGFSELHVFPYSPRTGTPAAKMDKQVGKDLKKDRVNKMIVLSEQLAKQYASTYEGELLDVIPEEICEEDDTMLLGYTDNYLRVRFEGDTHLSGELVRIKVTKANYPVNDGQFVTVLQDALHSVQYKCVIFSLNNLTVLK